MELDNNQQAFFALLRAGLWEKEARLLPFGKINYPEVYKLAEEQSVIGLIAAGLEYIKDDKVSQDITLRFAGATLQMEQRNNSMNSFIEWLIVLLRKKDIHAILVKGQGIAQCYERPLWRACGDVDLFLSEKNYKKAALLLKQFSTYIGMEEKDTLHLPLIIHDWEVELHGTLSSRLWMSLENELRDLQNDIFHGGNVRSWQNGNTQVFLLREDEDVVFVFAHILQHFFNKGIGFRQICEWCRLLWIYKNTLNHKLLESRLYRAGVMTEWRAFGALAIDYLGMPSEAMPLYSSDKKWSHKAKKICSFIMEVGNFGHNRDYGYYKKYPYLVYKAVSLWRHCKDFWKYFVIFPIDAIKVTWRKMVVGLTVVFKGEKHK